MDLNVKNANDFKQFESLCYNILTKVAINLCCGSLIM